MPRILSFTSERAKQYNQQRNKHVAINVSINVKYLRIPIISSDNM